MKRLLLLFALKCYALTLPSINNPSVWSYEEKITFKEMSVIAFRYSEPFEGFYNAKIDFNLSTNKFFIASGVGTSVLDSIYRETEFSAIIGYRVFDFIAVNFSERANISWVPHDASWYEHNISTGLILFYKDFARLYAMQAMNIIEDTKVKFYNTISCEIDFNSLYLLGFELLINKSLINEIGYNFYQHISLGFLSVYNSFAYPGPTLGFGIILNAGKLSAGVGYLRGSYSKGHTGYITKWNFK